MLTDSIKKTFAGDYKTPWHAYRAIYYATDCGPTIGFRINGKWVYCDDLPAIPWGTYEKTGAIDGVSVSSIVEGSDVEIEGAKLTGDFTEKEFWELIEAVNSEAGFYWERDNSEWFYFDSQSPPIKTTIKSGWDGIELPEDVKDLPAQVQNRIKHLINNWFDENPYRSATFTEDGKKYTLTMFAPDWTY